MWIGELLRLILIVDVSNAFLFSMPSTSSCRCDARGYLHAHCYCPIYNCNGKAVSRSTYQHHRKAAQESQILSSSDLHEAREENVSEKAPIAADCNSEAGKLSYLIPPFPLVLNSRQKDETMRALRTS